MAQGSQGSAPPSDLERIVVINDASVARGGATGLALLSVRRLLERGHEVAYLCGDAGDDGALAALGASVVPMGGKPLMAEGRARAATRGLYNAEARRGVADWIAANDTPRTAYHLHGWSKILSPSVFDALRPVRARTVVHAHDFFLACPNGGYMDYQAGEPCERTPLGVSCLTRHCDKRSYAQKLWRVGRSAALSRSFHDAADYAGILTIHERMIPWLARAGLDAGSIRTIRNPVTPFTTERIEAERHRAIAFVGRVEAEKGIEEALDAAREAGVPMMVIGDGPLRETLETSHPEATFHGWCDRERIAALVAHARALVMPTRYPEPFGLVAAEASRSGLPVIASRTAFLSGEIESGGVGLAPGSGHAALVEAFARMRDMPEDEVAAMSRRAHEGEVRLASTEDEWIDALVKEYRGALGRAVSAPSDEAGRRAAS